MIELFGRKNHNVCGIIIAGNGDLKTTLSKSTHLTLEIKRIILGTIEVNYGGKAGFNEAIKKSYKLIKENELIKTNTTLMEIISMIENENKCDLLAFGCKETINFIKSKMLKYVVLCSEFYKYVLLGLDGNVIFLKSEMELNGIKINLKELKVFGFNEYFGHLCLQNHTQLIMIGNDSNKAREFANNYGGCVGVMYFKTECVSMHEND